MSCAQLGRQSSVHLFHNAKALDFQGALAYAKVGCSEAAPTVPALTPNAA
jgi:hypothetical protein